jgi:pimeloyl-ACP methyl ester carboxylesterase
MGTAAVVNGATLAYDVTGNGPAVVLISGGGTLDRRLWDAQVAALSPQYTVVRYDIRGIGGSSRPDAPFSHSEDLRALLQTLGIAPAYVVGLSFGAGVAIDLALDHPELVKGLVLAAPGLSSDRDENVQAALAAADLARIKGLPFVAEAIVTNSAVLAAAGAEVRQRVKASYLDNADVFESDFALVRLWLPTDPPAGQRLSSIRVPTLILVGDQDGVHVRAIADTLAARISGAEMTVVRGAGHLLHLDAPDLFDNAVLDFLARAQARR